MDQTERFYKIDRLLRSQRYISMRALQDELDVSRATVNRDLEYMRSRLYAPIEWSPGEGGYWLNLNSEEAQRYQLPGLWFNQKEVSALLVLESLLRTIQPGVIDPYTHPLRERLEALLEESIEDRDQLQKRIKILSMGQRVVPNEQFALLAYAVLRRRRLDLVYEVRSRNETTTRIVSVPPSRHSSPAYRTFWSLQSTPITASSSTVPCSADY